MKHRRPHFFARILLLAPLACGAQTQPAAEIKVQERQILGASQLRGHHAPRGTSTHEITPTLVHFSGSGWPRDAILKAAGAAADILGQCGVRLAQAELMLVDAPQQYQYFQTLVSRELARALQPGKPTVYFVTDTRQQPAFDAEAIGRGNSKTRPELADSVWVTRATRDPGIALAHELAHVLMDSGEHVEEPGNLMREDTAPGNTRLSAAQCVQLRQTGEKNGILRKVAGSPGRTRPGVTGSQRGTSRSPTATSPPPTTSA
ncbi:MAG: hypothetical protein ACK4N4_03435 [Burkholderiales bacterium]